MLDRIAPSRRPPGRFVSLHQLKPENSSRVKHAIGNILALNSTQLAIAQIKDNKAIRGHFHVQRRPSDKRQPDIELRSAPSDDAMKFAQDYCQEFDPTDLKIDAQVSISCDRPLITRGI
jgi:hypothetical protein